MISELKSFALAEVESGNFQAAAEKLQTIEDVVPNPTHWTFGLISSIAGIDLAGKIASVIDGVSSANQPDSALFKSIFVALSTTGVQLHTSERQAMIDKLGAGLNPAEVAQVKSLRLRRSKRFPTITADQVKTAWEEEERTNRMNQFQGQIDSIKNKIGTPEENQIPGLLRSIANSFEGI